MELKPIERSETEEIVLKFFDLQCQKVLTGHMLSNTRIDLYKDVISQGVHMIFKSSMAAEVLQETEKTAYVGVRSEPFPASISDCFKLYLQQKLKSRLGTKRFKINMVTNYIEKKVTMKFERTEAYPRLNIVYPPDITGNSVRKERILLDIQGHCDEKMKPYRGD